MKRALVAPAAMAASAPRPPAPATSVSDVTRVLMATAMVLALGSAVACRRDVKVETDPPPDAAADTRPPMCPSSPPRVGTACLQPGSLQCRYEVGRCAAEDGDRPDERTFCCLGGTWKPCGTDKPCTPVVPDRGPEPAVEASDAATDGTPGDAPADAPDAAADGAGDAAPEVVDTGSEAPLCGGKPPPAVCDDAQACSPCPGGGFVPCACVAEAWFCMVCADGGVD